MHYTDRIVYTLMSDQMVYKETNRFDRFNVLSQRVAVWYKGAYGKVKCTLV